MGSDAAVLFQNLFRIKIMRCSRRRSRRGNLRGNPQCRFHMKTTVQTTNDNFSQDSVEWLPEGEPEAMADYSGYYCETYKELVYFKYGIYITLSKAYNINLDWS